MSVRELAIVGGGPVGLSAALAAAHRGIDVILLEAQEDAHVGDPRVFALSYATQLILDELGVWAHVAAAHAIRSVHVSERDAFGAATLDTAMLDLPALGYVVAHSDLVQALRRRMSEQHIESITRATVTTVTEQPDDVVLRYTREDDERSLAVSAVALAEGGASLASGTPIVEREYRQCALTATITAQYAIDDWAYERFTPQGPMALLPIGGAHALIWTVPSTDAERLLALEDREFERAVAECYGSRIGAVRLRGARAAFPLKLRFARQLAGPRVALIGNSAQTLHPVAGQGFNLGLRDAYELAAALATSTANAQPLIEGLRRFRSQRRVDRAGGTLFTDFLVRAFSNDNPLVACARTVALASLDAIEPAKRFLLRRMIFGASR